MVRESIRDMILIHITYTHTHKRTSSQQHTHTRIYIIFVCHIVVIFCGYARNYIHYHIHGTHTRFFVLFGFVIDENLCIKTHQPNEDTDNELCTVIFVNTHAYSPKYSHTHTTHTPTPHILQAFISNWFVFCIIIINFVSVVNRYTTC